MPSRVNKNNKEKKVKTKNKKLITQKGKRACTVRLIDTILIAVTLLTPLILLWTCGEEYKLGNIKTTDGFYSALTGSVVMWGIYILALHLVFGYIQEVILKLNVKVYNNNAERKRYRVILKSLERVCDIFLIIDLLGIVLAPNSQLLETTLLTLCVFLIGYFHIKKTLILLTPRKIKKA